MDLDDIRTMLKKTRVRELDPALRKEVLGLASELENETTITTKSNLHFIFELYQKERKRDKKNLKILRKAEQIMANLAELHQLRHERNRPPIKRDDTPIIGRHFGGSEMQFSRKITELFESIGITERKEMERIVGIIGEREVETRIETIHISKLEGETAKALFGKHPELLCIPEEAAFFEKIEGIEKKIAVIDAYMNSTGIPESMDYRKFSDVLLLDMGEVVSNLNMDTANKVTKDEVTETAEQQKGPKYIARTMKTKEMAAVLAALGYVKDRGKNELVYTLHQDRRKEGMAVVLTMSNPHDGEYEKGVVRFIIRDMGIRPDEFEKVRRSV